MKVAPVAYDKLVAKKLANKVIKKAISQTSPIALKNNSSKSFKCRKCEQAFVTRGLLMTHKCKGNEMDQTVNKAKETEVSKPDAEKLKCLKCKGIYFPSEAALKHHRILHAGFKPYTCNVCSITFENETKWQSHVEQSAKQSDCEECLQFFGCLIAKQRHICLESSYFCTFCGAQFKKSLAFDRHLERCKLKMDCNICGRKFVKRGAFKQHMKLIHDVTVTTDVATSTPQQSLKETPNLFTTIDNFIKQGQEKQDSTIHIESETIHLNGPVSSLVMCSVIPTPNGKKSTKETNSGSECEVCQRSFSSARAKHIHQRIHFKQKPVTIEFKSMCETCNKRTNFKKQIGECKSCPGELCTCGKPNFQYICTECSDEYTKSVNEVLICKQCQELFDDETVFKEHSSSHDVDASPETPAFKVGSRRSYKCSLCHSSFRNMKAHRRSCRAKNLNATKRSGQKVCCLQCEKVLANKVQFEAHLKFCGGNVNGEDLENNELKRLKSTLNESALLNASGTASIECNKCMKIFRTPKHLEMHDKQVHKDYQCEFCFLMFWKSDDLTNHLRIHKKNKKYICEICRAVLSSPLQRRNHRIEHFAKDNSSVLPISCKHCDGSFKFLREFEMHCKKLTIDEDGKFQVLKSFATPRKRKYQRDVSVRSRSASRSRREEHSDEETSFEAENKDEADSSSPIPQENESMAGEMSPKSRAGSPVEFNNSNYPTSPSIFESEIPYEEEDDDEEMELSKDKAKSAQNGIDSDFESTVELIESSRRDEPITSDCNLVYLAVTVMDTCIRSRGMRRASTRVRKIIKEVFKLIVDHPVTIERPHTCSECGKMFIHPQGITNHYYRKHGSRGILQSLSMLKNRKELPIKVDKKPRRQRKSDQSKMETDTDGDVVSCRQVENNVSPKDEPVLIELRNNISKLLCHLVSDSDVLAELGWPKRLIDDVLIDVISRCESRPSLDARKSRLSRLRENITTLLSICVKEQAMENFGWNEKPVDEVVKEMLAGGEIATA